MSIAGTFDWRNGLSVLSGRLSGRQTDKDGQCNCLCERSRELWDRSPGRTAVFTPQGVQLWISQDLHNQPGANDGVAPTFLEQLDNVSREKMLDCLAECVAGANEELKLFPVNMNGQESGTGFPHVAHFAALPSCGAHLCSPKIIVTLLETSGPSADLPDDRIATSQLHGSVLDLQSRVHDFGDAPDIAPFERGELQPVRLDLSEQLRTQAASLQATFEFAGIDFKIGTGEDIPAIFHDPRLLSRLVRALFEVAESMGGMQPGIRIEISRLASCVEINAVVCQMIAGDTSCHEPAEAALLRLERVARHCGKLRRLVAAEQELRMRLSISINATMVAPEPAANEERIVRLPKAANRNANPMPRDQKTG